MTDLENEIPASTGVYAVIDPPPLPPKHSHGQKLHGHKIPERTPSPHPRRVRPNALPPITTLSSYSAKPVVHPHKIGYYYDSQNPVQTPPPPQAPNFSAFVDQTGAATAPTHPRALRSLPVKIVRPTQPPPHLPYPPLPPSTRPPPPPYFP